MLRRHGVIGWRHTLADLITDTTTTSTVAPRTDAAPLLPAPAAAELVHVLAALALAGT